MKKKTVLFDIDYTLFNTEEYRKNLYSTLSSNLGYDKNTLDTIGHEIYEVVKKEQGYFDPKIFSEQLAFKIGKKEDAATIKEAIWDTKHFSNNLYEETGEILKILSKRATIGIFSQGYDEFQRAKLLAIKDFFQQEHIHITLNKHTSLPTLFKQYKENSLYLVDDALDVLHTAKKLRNDITVIWVKRGKYAKLQSPIEGFVPDAIIETLHELLDTIV